MKGKMLVESAAMGYSGAAQRVFHGARRADVHGRSRAAHRLRQRREPAHRARVHAAEGDRGAAVARRVARTPGEAAADESLLLSFLGGARRARARRRDDPRR